MRESQDWSRRPEVTAFLDGIKQDPQWEWRRQISFWGIVVDEMNNPIEGASVQFSWNDLSAEGTSFLSDRSNSRGEFSLQGKLGKVLIVSLEHDGFKSCDGNAVPFEYANPTDQDYHQPDPNRPVLFRLIRKGPMEPLVKRERMSFRVDEQSGDLYLDLLGQRSVPALGPGVDLIVHAKHGPIREEEGARWYDWKVVLSVPDGGIQIGSECPPAAPEGGYQPHLAFSGKVEANRPPGEVFDWFFLKSRGGQHVARIHIKVVPAPTGGGAPKVLLAEYVLNPAGSLGLEFYDEMQVADKYYISPDPDYVPPRRE